MTAKESNREFILDFLRKASSLKETDQEEAIGMVKDVAFILGLERLAVEGLPILANCAHFYPNGRLVRLVRELPVIEVEMRKPQVVDAMLLFFGEFLNSEDEELRLACLRKIAAVLKARPEPAKLQNFLSGLHASDGAYRRLCIFEFLQLELLPDDLYRDAGFFEDFFGRLLDEPSPSMRRMTLKQMFTLLAKHPQLFPAKFMKGIFRQVSDDKTPSVAMHALPCALRSGDPVLIDEQFSKTLKSKSPYLLKSLLDSLEAVKSARPALFGDEFVDLYCGLFYEPESDLRNMSFDALDSVLKVVSSDPFAVKIVNNLKQSVVSNATKETKYNATSALLRASGCLTRDQCIDLVLKHLLAFLREEQESFDVYFIQSLRPFVQKCGYDVLRESLDLFFRSIIIHCSQGVS